MPLVSVITAAYNAEAYIYETIKSVLAQTFEDWEYIVVDDGSTDGTAKIIQSFPEIQYIYQPNQGVASARNKALSYASGDYIAVVDADDVWFPDKLSMQMEVMQRNSEAGLCYTNASTIDRVGRIIQPRRIPVHKPITYIHALTRAHYIITSSVLMRRRYLESQPYQDSLPPCEDFHVNLLILYKSGPGIFLDEVLVFYRERVESISRANRFQWITQNENAVTRFLSDATAIRPLPDCIRRRALGHLAYQRAQVNIKAGGSIKTSSSLLIKALLMNPSDTWKIIRQFSRIIITLNARLNCP